MTTALTPSPFSAAPSATGYLYQCRYALLLLLQRSRQDIDAQLAVEKFDDISFESSGNPTDLIQTKHHIGAIASLIDTSTDLWKTLRVWSEAVRSGTAQPTSTVFTLITCAIAAPVSAASLLRSGAMRDPDRAHSILVSTANRMKGEGLKAARDAFLALSDDQRKQMLRATQIVDGASTITTVYEDIRREINWAVRETHLSAFQQRLEGWWFNEIIVSVRPTTSFGDRMDSARCRDGTD